MKLKKSMFLNAKIKNNEFFDKDYTETEIGKAFGDSIKRLRIHKGMSLNALSKEIDIPNPTINRYENGINIPTLAQALKIANYFDLSIDLLIAVGLNELYGTPDPSGDITTVYDAIQAAIKKIQ
jgi:transcriptional regulator with XRE-family HTH domain